MAPVYFSPTLDKYIQEISEERPKATRWKLIKATSEEALGDVLRTLFRPSRRGAEAGFGAYLVVSAVLAWSGWVSHDPEIAAITGGFFSVKWASVLAGAGCLVWEPLRAAMRWVMSVSEVLGGLSDTAGGFDLGDIWRIGHKAKQEVTELPLAAPDRAYFFAAIDRAEFVSDITSLVGHARRVAERHPA